LQVYSHLPLLAFGECLDGSSIVVDRRWGKVVRRLSTFKGACDRAARESRPLGRQWSDRRSAGKDCRRELACFPWRTGRRDNRCPWASDRQRVWESHGVNHGR